MFVNLKVQYNTVLLYIFLHFYQQLSQGSFFNSRHPEPLNLISIIYHLSFYMWIQSSFDCIFSIVRCQNRDPVFLILSYVSDNPDEY